MDSPDLQLLWHGTRWKNLEPILKSGLLPNPHSASDSGSDYASPPFGCGVYFSDYLGSAGLYAINNRVNEAGFGIQFAFWAALFILAII